MPNKPANVKFTIWQMFSNIFVAAINKGQLPVAILGLLLVILLFRLPVEDLSKFAYYFLENLRNGYLLGYFLFTITLTGWFFHAKRQRQVAANESKRLIEERTTLQKQELGKQVRSSKR